MSQKTKISTCQIVLFLSFIFFLHYYSSAQIEHKAAFHELKTPITESHIYIASNYNELKQGFLYSILPGSALMWLKLDENIIGPHPYQPEVPGTERPLNKSFPVGSLPGSFNVSSGGSANYSIPIEVPPGTNGMVPSMSIVYSSSGAGRGYFGYGFDLGGTSQIDRTGKDLFHDGIITPVMFNDANDKFTLDGERLLLVSGTYGVAGSEYRPECQFFTKVLLKSDGTNLYFEVWTRNGLIKEYGKTNENRIERNAPNTNGICTWILNKVKDYDGNYIQFNYIKNKEVGEYYIDKILYTGNEKTSLQPYNEMKFYYDEFAEQNTLYHSGSKFIHRIMIRKIKTFCEGKLVRTYQFKYSQNLYSHLNEIILAAGDGTRLNSTVINWGTPTAPVTTTFDYEHFDEAGDLKDVYKKYPTCFADVNGDGVKEVVVFKTVWSTPMLSWELKKYVDGPLDNDNHLESVSTGILDSYNNGNDTVHENTFVRVIPNDFDKDGKDELLLLTFKRNEDGPAAFYGICRMFKFNSSNVLVRVPDTQFEKFEFFTAMEGPGNGQWKQNHNALIDYNFHIGDFNGDGFTDIFYSDGGAHFQLKSYKFIANQWQLVSLNNNINIEYAFQEDMVSAGDFDGDGLAELIWFDQLIEFKNDGTYNMIYCPELYNFIENEQTQYKRIKEIKTGDFNGDGLSDLFYRVEETSVEIISQHEDITTFNSHWHIAYSKGIVYDGGGKTSTAHFDIQEFENNWNYQYRLYHKDQIPNVSPEKFTYEGINRRLLVADINDDGKADIVDAAFVFNNMAPIVPDPPPPRLPTNNFITQSWLGKILISYGNGFININPEWDSYPWNQSNGKILYKGDCGYYPEEYYIFNDFTGNGNLQVFDGLKSYDVKPNLASQKVVAITDGYNSQTRIEYKTLLHSGVYTKGSGAQFPLSDVVAPLCVVSKVNYDNGTEDGANILYQYEGLKVHNLGKGSLGFFKNNTIDQLSQKQSSQTYEIANTMFYDKVLKSSEVRYAMTGQLLYESTNTNYARWFSLGGWYIRYNYPSNVISKNYLNNTMSTSEYTYDDYMNITTNYSAVKIIGAANDEWSNYAIYDPYTIINNNNYWIPGLLSFLSITTTKYGEFPYIRNVAYTYKDDGKLLTVTNEPTEVNKTTTTYTYEPNYGNITEQKVSGKSNITGTVETRSVTIEYTDAKYRYPSKVTNNKGHFAVFTFDPCFGSALTLTDANANLTQCTYDVFGRPKTVTTPDNNTITATIEWANASFGNALFLIRTVAPGRAPLISYYDRLMRPVKLESKGFNNEVLYKDYSYNIYGFRDKESLPYFIQDVGNRQWININHDPVTGRLLTVQGPAIDIAYAYNNTKTTLTDNIMGVSKWVLTDAAGNITQSHDDGGTINFAYNSQGLIKSITDPSNNISLMSYDIFGNQTSLNDPDAGTSSYTYDAFGQLLTQTDARGAITQLFYDELGRMLQRKEAMDGLGNFKTTSYTYDTKTKGIGMLSSVVNSDGYAEDYNYDLYSRLLSSKTTIEGVDYNKSIVYDKYGRVRQYNYPSGFGIKYNYNPGTGDLLSMSRTDNNQTVWQCAEVNALGQIEKFVLGNGLSTTNTFDDQTHLLTGIKTGTENNAYVQNMQYIYNSKLQLSQRKDNRTGYMLTETFTYDDLNRLTSSQVTTQSVSYETITVSYDVAGNISSKSDVGTYSYDLPKPHALTKIIPHTGITPPADEQNITYNEFGKVSSISEGNKQLYYTYGAGQQRIKSEFYENDALVKRKYYVGNYEKETTNGVTRELHYITAPSGLVGIMEKKEGVNKMYYIHSDISGSFTSITDENASIVEEMNFDAWGKRRNPTDWSYNNVATSFLFDRGYTGHEMLDAFGLINMNGRMYDPTNARFLSPDPFVQDPLNSQNYNRFSYCLNNPVMYTDPTGYQHTWYTNEPGRGNGGYGWPGGPQHGTPIHGSGSGGFLHIENEGLGGNGANNINNGQPNKGRGSGGGGGGASFYMYRKSDPIPTNKVRPCDLQDPNHYNNIEYKPNVSSTYNTDGNVVKNGASYDYYFNESGNYVGRHQTNSGICRLVIENTISCRRQYYMFSDAINDPIDIEAGVIDKVVFVSKAEIQEMLSAKGAFDEDNKNDWFHFGNESDGGGDFDYSITTLPDNYSEDGASYNPMDENNLPKVLFIPEGSNIAYNQMNFGNFLWAASGYTLGFSLGTLLDFANMFTLVRHHEFDSKDDQLSIMKGVVYAEKNKFRLIKKKQK